MDRPGAVLQGLMRRQGLGGAVQRRAADPDIAAHRRGRVQGLLQAFRAAQSAARPAHQVAPRFCDGVGEPA